MGPWPAIAAVRVVPHATLQESSRAASGAVSRPRARAMLVVAVVALAVGLAIAASVPARRALRVVQVLRGE